MARDAFSRWSNGFRRDAVKDEMVLLRTHLNRIGFPDEPSKMIDGTIMLMSACLAYCVMDKQPTGEILALQRYRPDVDPGTHYSFTFNLFDDAYGRIITPARHKWLDLADLYGHPWQRIKKCGYSDFRVTHIDGGDLTEAESDEIENAIEEDIRFDYGEDEVSIWFDRHSTEGVLICHVSDVFPKGTGDGTDLTEWISGASSSR